MRGYNPSCVAGLQIYIVNLSEIFHTTELFS